MSALKPFPRSFAAFLSFGLCFGLGIETSAQTVATVPVGAMTINIVAGTGLSRTVTPVSFPLDNSATGSGQIEGRITSVTANSISNSNAGWTAATFSTPVIPYLIRITSGNASGRTFLISSSSSNTATTVTIDAEEAGLVDLTTLGISLGDSYSILPCDTLSSLFGAPATSGIVGGTSVSGAGADIVFLMVSGGWLQYYYNTSGTPGWKRVGINTDSDNIPIRPDSLVLYSRIGSSPLSLILTGVVPSVSRKQIVRNSGVTPLSNPWPSGTTTLASSGIAATSGWQNNASYVQADIVQVMVSGGWLQYFFDGVNWRRVGLNTISDSVEMPVGAGVLIRKRGGAASSSVVGSSMPYTL